MMFEPQYQPDPRVPGLGLAFWRGEAGGHRIIEHGGVLTGFHSEVAHLDVYPMSAYKRPPVANPRRLVTGALAGVPAAVAG
jgi:hypothetical protein